MSSAGKQLITLPYKGYAHLVQECRAEKLWHFLNECKAKVDIPGKWILQLQRKGDRYLMEVAPAVGFSNQDQIPLREAATILQVHKVSDIVTLNGIKINKGVNDGHTNDRESCYRWPRAMEWFPHHTHVFATLM